MKKAAFCILILLLLFALASCPELLEDPDNYVTLSFSGALNHKKWLDILTQVGNQTRFVNLDLSDAISAGDFPNVNGDFSGAFFRHTFPATIASPHEQEFLIFNPLPWLNDHDQRRRWDADAIRSAKSRIVHITLPRSATMIDNANTSYGVPASRASAFRDFTNLRTIRGDNIRVIGNHAFFGLSNLQEVYFPLVGFEIGRDRIDSPVDLSALSITDGFWVHVGNFAFWGTTSLTRVNFTHARIIGESAFENSGLTEISTSDFTFAWKIGQRAFRGNRNLREVAFPSATIIGNEAFQNCTSLITARFLANPDRFSPPPYEHPLQGFINGVTSDPSYPVTLDSVIFNRGAFEGSSLSRLEVPNAWNVYFAADSLANIGTHLEFHLFDDEGADRNGRSFGHPQTDDFLGDRVGGVGTSIRTVTSVYFVLPYVPSPPPPYPPPVPPEPPPSPASVFLRGLEKQVGVNGVKINTLIHDIRGRYGEVIADAYRITRH